MCLMLLGMMKTTILYTLYEYNRASFIEMFCVNKERPQFNCNGKCKLALMQQEENEKRANDILKQLQLEIVYFSPVKPIAFSNIPLSLWTVKAKLPLYYSHNYTFLFISRSVKPPEVSRA